MQSELLCTGCEFLNKLDSHLFPAMNLYIQNFVVTFCYELVECDLYIQIVSSLLCTQDVSF